mmetsp:Transcript_30276/g.62655  ORF Transcript_30276/g.62655 Transcript_30276/m.62655 type:complete len:266 (+) Transcript_30276:281-1078(+)
MNLLYLLESSLHSLSAILVNNTMCNLTKRIPNDGSSRDFSRDSKSSIQNLQPFGKSPVGNFSTTTPSSSVSFILKKHDKIEAHKKLVAQVGLENFIRNVTKPLDLKLPNRVKFNMNGQGIMQTWEDVFLAERVYTRCLGISKRIYRIHAYTHEPQNNLAYFVLEETNERSYWFLPVFDFHVLVFTYYDENKDVTRVDVQYDQMSFFLHCMGLAQAHAWVVERLITPMAVVWARCFLATGIVNPFTFLVQLLFVPTILVYWVYFSQ